MLLRFGIFLLIMFGLIQIFPVNKTNPEVKGEIEVPNKIADIFERSCYDCHSNETVWPWYSKVAPVSWIMVSDVNEGREYLNFSEWDKYSPEKKAEKIKEIWEEVEEGEMPFWYYVSLHPEAKLSDGDKADIKEWSESGTQ